MNATEAPIYRPRVPDGVQVEQRDSLYLLLHPQAPRWAMVNATGLAVARLCDGQCTVPQIAAALAAPYGLDSNAVLPDVYACLDALRRARFLDEEVHSEEAHNKHNWRLHLYLTEGCNLRCTHCGVEAGTRPPDNLSSDTVRRLIDEAIATGAEGIAFSGGEPLLRDDCLDLLRYATQQSWRAADTSGSEQRVKVLLSTNAVLIDDATAATLAELGIIIQVSLDGATAATHDAVRGPGSFARAWEGMARLQRHGVSERLALNVTLMSHNVDEVAEIVALAAEHGVPGVRFCPVQHMGRAAEQWDTLAPNMESYASAYGHLYHESPPPGVMVSQGLPGLELEPPEGRMWCGLGHLLLVDSRGDLYPCALLTTPEFRLGNVADTSLADALASEKLGELVALCERRKDEIEACQSCAWRHFCQGGCPGAIWLEYGTWHSVDGFCDLRRDLYRDLIFDHVERRQPLTRVDGICDVP